MIKVKYNNDSCEIYAGNVTKNGFGAHYNKVTEDCVISTMEYIVNARMTSDDNQAIELIPKINKRGKNYKITIVIEKYE